MKVLSVLGKIAIGAALAFGVFVLLAFGILMYAFKDYKGGGVGYDLHGELKNPRYDKYRSFLMDANRDYFNSDSLYYFIAKEVKDHIAGECVDRDLKDRNITDTSGWRFALNTNMDYISKNNIPEDTVNEKFSKNMDKSRRRNLNRFVLQHTYEYDKRIDCNRSMDEVYEDYVKNYRKTQGWHNLDQDGQDWISYLFFNYK